MSSSTLDVVQHDLSCVMIVDDDLEIREALEEAIEQAGYRTITATNGREARRLLDQVHPGAIILDLWMPVMDGNQLYAAMKADPMLTEVPVAIATSVPKDAPPGVTIFPKPLNLTALMQWLAQHCRLP